MILRPVDALQAIEPGLATLRFARALPGLVLADELFGPGNERPLLLIVFLLSLAPLGAEHQVTGIRRRIVLDLAERELHRSAGDPVQEVTIVGNGQAGAVPAPQETLEPLEH